MTDWRAIGVGAAVHYLLGALWYAPATFGGPWARATGLEAPPDDQRPIAYAGPLVGSVLSAAATTSIARRTTVSSASGGARVGLLVGAGYGVGLSTTYAASPTVARPVTLAVITGSYQVLGHVLAGAAIGALRGRAERRCCSGAPHRGACGSCSSGAPRQC